jgi:hypothetical protein
VNFLRDINPNFIPIYALFAIFVGFLLWEAIKLILFIITGGKFPKSKKK